MAARHDARLLVRIGANELLLLFPIPTFARAPFFVSAYKYAF